MKKNLRHKIRTFLQSEEGKATVKAPLALSIMSGSLLLTQAVLTPSVSADGCGSDCQSCVTICGDTGTGNTCVDICAD